MVGSVPAPLRRSKPTRFPYAAPRVRDPRHCQSIEHHILKTCGLWWVLCSLKIPVLSLRTGPPHYGIADPHDSTQRSNVCVPPEALPLVLCINYNVCMESCVLWWVKCSLRIPLERGGRPNPLRVLTVRDTRFYTPRLQFQTP